MNSNSFSSSKPRGEIQLQRQKFSKYYTLDHLSAQQKRFLGKLPFLYHSYPMSAAHRLGGLSSPLLPSSALQHTLSKCTMLK